MMFAATYTSSGSPRVQFYFAPFLFGLIPLLLGLWEVSTWEEFHSGTLRHVLPFDLFPGEFLLLLGTLLLLLLLLLRLTCHLFLTCQSKTSFSFLSIWILLFFSEWFGNSNNSGYTCHHGSDFSYLRSKWI